VMVNDSESFLYEEDVDIYEPLACWRLFFTSTLRTVVEEEEEEEEQEAGQ
jgi:hypothetical protein